MPPRSLALFLLALVAGVRASAAADPARYMTAELLVESPAPKPGSTVLVGFRMTPRPGWHGYWSNPGDSGIAPSVVWEAPAGIRLGPLMHPAPTLLTADGISSFVHAGPHVLLSRMTIPRSLAKGTPIPLKAKLSWAACTATQCVPLHATFAVDLVAGSGVEGPDALALKAAAQKLPRSAAPGKFSADGKNLRLLLPAALGLDVRRTRFFPDDSDSFAAASQRATEADGGIQISGSSARGPHGSVSGVVSDGNNAYRLEFRPDTPAETEKKPMIAPVADPAPRQPSGKPEGVAPKVEEARPSVVPPEGKWLWVVAPAALIVVAAGLLLTRHRRSQRPST